MTEAEFIDFVGNDIKGNIIGRAVAELQGPKIYEQLEKQGAFKMAEGEELSLIKHCKRMHSLYQQMSGSYR